MVSPSASLAVNRVDAATVWKALRVSAELVGVDHRQTVLAYRSGNEAVRVAVGVDIRSDDRPCIVDAVDIGAQSTGRDDIGRAQLAIALGRRDVAVGGVSAVGIVVSAIKVIPDSLAKVVNALAERGAIRGRSIPRRIGAVGIGELVGVFVRVNIIADDPPLDC
jgi:hypothetical protein